MLARAISNLGAHVQAVPATNGLEALQISEDGAADILITDMMMPEMTGIELIELLNARPGLSPAVAFLLTAHNSPGLSETACRLNVKDVIAKPVYPEWICHLVSLAMVELSRARLPSLETAAWRPELSNTVPLPDLEDLSISHLLWEVAKKFQPQADVKNQLLVVDKTEPESIVRGNAAQLRLMLRCLVWNAIKNTPTGGTVILSSKKDSDMVNIFIRDTGCGAQSSNLGDNPDFSSGPGNIGKAETDGNEHDLATVRYIAREYGGNLIVKCESGRGSCFTLKLPIHLTENASEKIYKQVK
jgi:CheY-like chemotaxis protein